MNLPKATQLIKDGGGRPYLDLSDSEACFPPAPHSPPCLSPSLSFLTNQPSSVLINLTYEINPCKEKYKGFILFLELPLMIQH